MLRGLPGSIILHGAIIFGGAVAWPYIAPERPVEELIVPVTLEMQLDSVTNVAPVIRREPEPEAPEPEPEEEPAAEEEVIEEEEDAEEIEEAEEDLDTTDIRELPQEPEPEEEFAEIEDDAEKNEEEPEPEEDEQEQMQAQTRDPDPLASVLGDASDLFSEVKQRERQPVKKQEKKILVDETEVREPQRGIGDPSKETARIQAMIASQMRVCWDDVIDLPNPERLNVVIRVSLAEDGSLDGDVQLVDPRRAPVGDRPMKVAVERALRAARKCAPYRLPKDALSSYDEWKDIKFRIGPGFGQ